MGLRGRGVLVRVDRTRRRFCLNLGLDLCRRLLLCRVHLRIVRVCSGVGVVGLLLLLRRGCGCVLGAQVRLYLLRRHPVPTLRSTHHALPVHGRSHLPIRTVRRLRRRRLLLLRRCHLLLHRCHHGRARVSVRGCSLHLALRGRHAGLLLLLGLLLLGLLLLRLLLLLLLLGLLLLLARLVGVLHLLRLALPLRLLLLLPLLLLALRLLLRLLGVRLLLLLLLLGLLLLLLLDRCLAVHTVSSRGRGRHRPRIADRASRGCSCGRVLLLLLLLLLLMLGVVRVDGGRELAQRAGVKGGTTTIHHLQARATQGTPWPSSHTKPSLNSPSSNPAAEKRRPPSHSSTAVALCLTCPPWPTGMAVTAPACVTTWPGMPPCIAVTVCPGPIAAGALVPVAGLYSTTCAGL